MFRHNLIRESIRLIKTIALGSVLLPVNLVFARYYDVPVIVKCTSQNKEVEFEFDYPYEGICPAKIEIGAKNKTNAILVKVDDAGNCHYRDLNSDRRIKCEQSEI